MEWYKYEFYAVTYHIMPLQPGKQNSHYEKVVCNILKMSIVWKYVSKVDNNLEANRLEPRSGPTLWVGRTKRRRRRLQPVCNSIKKYGYISILAKMG